ncbi:hypothetical protein Ddc_10571 [Ditylenchus destructor]|nr:hypothetical protein Ddc_10571 [Ditylenchus destructor]
MPRSRVMAHLHRMQNLGDSYLIPKVKANCHEICEALDKRIRRNTFAQDSRGPAGNIEPVQRVAIDSLIIN